MLLNAFHEDAAEAEDLELHFGVPWAGQQQ
jgi:hypothetical protein